MPRRWPVPEPSVSRRHGARGISSGGVRILPRRSGNPSLAFDKCGEATPRGQCNKGCDQPRVSEPHTSLPAGPTRVSGRKAESERKCVRPKEPGLSEKAGNEDVEAHSDRSARSTCCRGSAVTPGFSRSSTGHGDHVSVRSSGVALQRGRVRTATGASARDRNVTRRLEPCDAVSAPPAPGHRLRYCRIRYDRRHCREERRQPFQTWPRRCARTLRQIGLTIPVDLAGNSLGGTIALEAARRGIARSVVAISPPGLWKAHPAPHVKYVFRSLRFMAGNYPRS